MWGIRVTHQLYITLDIYAHLVDEDRGDLAKEIEAILGLGEAPKALGRGED